MKTLKSVVLLFFAVAVLAVPPAAFASDYPLHDAAQKNDVVEVERLLANGADINAKDDLGRTPLHKAVLNNAGEVAEVLLANGADINAKADYGYIPLHFSAVEDDVEIAKALLANGSDINAKTDHGYTSLHTAAQENAVEVAKVLLANGADINGKAHDDDTAYDMAVQYNAKEIAEILRNYTPGQFAHLKVTPKPAGKESDYVRAWCEENDGKMRARLEDGSIADCLTAEYAVEFDFALPVKSYECTGQALHYANIAKRKPLCILIEKPEKSIADFAAAVRKIPPQVEVRCMDAKGKIFDCPK